MNSIALREVVVFVFTIMGKGPDKTKRKRRRHTQEEKERSNVRKENARKEAEDKKHLKGQRLMLGWLQKDRFDDGNDEQQLSLSDNEEEVSLDNKKADGYHSNDDVVEEEPPARIEIDPEPIDGRSEEDDDDDHDDSNYDPDDDPNKDLFDECEGGTMGTYLKAVHDRLKLETNSQGPAQQKWLLNMLAKNEWWIHHSQAKSICEKLAIEFDEPSYYRSIFVWLPDVCWGVEAMPFCACCRQNNKVKVHGWRDNHFGRVVIALYGHYYVVSRRYRCVGCLEAIVGARQVAENAGAAVEEDFSEKQYTFMGYNEESRELLPFGFGNDFPAFFTHRCAVDKTVIDLMRPLFVRGIRPSQMRDLLLELATKQHTQDAIKREFEIKRRRQFDPNHKKGVLFSQFADPQKYAGKVPSSNYLSHVYKKFSKTLKTHFDREVKKRGARRLSWDASYKEAKHLCRFHGKQVFRALITATNEIGEVCIQFHVVTDGHDQMVNALREFLDTCNKYGQHMPEFVFTDKPMDDFNFFTQEIPSIARKQQQLDRKIGPPIVSALIDQCVIDDDDFEYLTSSKDIDNKLRALVGFLRHLPPEEQVVSFDAEWAYGSKVQFPPSGRDRIGVGQLGFLADKESKKIKALVMHLRSLQKLPDGFLLLLGDPTIRYVGKGVKGDLEKLGTDFQCTNLTKAIIQTSRYVDLAHLAVTRGVVDKATCSLQRLVVETLHQALNKDDSIRSSDWSKKNAVRAANDLCSFGCSKIIGGISSSCAA